MKHLGQLSAKIHPMHCLILKKINVIDEFETKWKNIPNAYAENPNAYAAVLLPNLAYTSICVMLRQQNGSTRIFVCAPKIL